MAAVPTAAVPTAAATLPTQRPQMPPSQRAQMPQRAPVASGRAAPTQGGAPLDLAQKLRQQQNARIRAAIDHLTSPGVWKRPCEENMSHIQDSLSITDAEVSMVFERAQDIVLKPALEFLALPVIRTQPVTAKVAYLQQKLGLHDEDIARAFDKIKDYDGVAFFAQNRVKAAVDFLASPALAGRPPEVKLDYLRTRLRLSEVEIAEAYKMLAEREREAEKGRILREMEAVGHAVLPNLLDEATRLQLMAALRQGLDDVIPQLAADPS